MSLRRKKKLLWKKVFWPSWPHMKRNEDSQSYYSENSEEEDMQSAYQLQYVEFLKLREKYKQQVQCG
jgi:hypothetical protein